ncbi:hypothetical protein J1N35_017890 [Gossypium stocksii]|uniref:Uncharacterized protein n=1 Tax=Gossypium stocksii TaxID=47602 RepID=A0A9D3VPS0_9ROSI|nr:hypothetical protein J1N35_017890 [Gossypium stocksii]
MPYLLLVEVRRRASPSPAYYTPMSMSMSMPTHVPTPMVTPMSSSILVSMSTYLGFATSYGYSPLVSQTPIASLFYRCGSLSQPYSSRMEDT